MAASVRSAVAGGLARRVIGIGSDGRLRGRHRGPFSLADPDRVRAVLEAAGFGSIIVAPHADQVVISADQIPEAALTSVRTGGARGALRDVDQQTRDRALTAIEDALRARLHDGQVRASRGVLLVTASA